MKKTAWLHWTVTLIFGITVWLFFAVFYRHHLHYQEEMQLFLTTGAYFLDTVASPGGLAGYLSQFVTQFFVDSFVGGFCIALLLIVLQRLVWRVAVVFSKKTNCYLLSFIPSVGYACALMDENFLLTALFALIFVLLAALLGQRIKPLKGRCACLLGAIPLLYWIGGGGYYRYPGIFPVILLVIFLLVLLMPVLFRYLPEAGAGKSRLMSGGVQLGVLLVLAGGGLHTYADWEKEEILAYDYFSRSQKWHSIIHLADKKAPTSPLSVASLNLALAKQNLLPNYMFEYFQNGPEGLLPTFQKEFIRDVMTGEIYYHLGLVNTAQRFAFEGMEAIPGYQKSARCLKRLAETNLINGHYEVANKYLSILKQTLFYRRWATETATYLYNEPQINAHPEWGTLRQFRPKEDFLFSEQEKDQVLGILYQNNTDNRMAYEYLLAYTLLVKDLQHFYDYYRLPDNKKADEAVPKSYREALAVIKRQVQLKPGMSEAAFSHQYGRSYLYYLMYRYK